MGVFTKLLLRALNALIQALSQQNGAPLLVSACNGAAMAEKFSTYRL